MGWKRLASALLVCLTLTLSACGGGGGGDKQPAASPSATQGSGFTMDRSSVAVSALAGAAIAAEVVNINITDARVAEIVAGFPDLTVEPSWIKLSPGGGGNARQLILNFNTAGLTAGTRKVTVRVFAGSDAVGEIGHQDIAVTLTVTASTVPPNVTPVTIAPSPASIQMQGLQYGSSSLPATVDLGINDGRVVQVVTTNAPGSSTPWLTSSVARQGSGWQMTATAAPSVLANTGNFQSTVRVVAIDINGQVIGSKDIAVSVRVLPRLTALSSGAATGLVGIAGSPTHLRTAVTILADGLSWQASTLSPFPATLDTTAGSNNQNLTLDIDLSTATPADSGVTIVVKSTDGQQTTLVVPVKVQTPVLTPSMSQLTGTAVNGAVIAPIALSLGINNGTDPQVSITTDAPWLGVTRTAQKVSSGFNVVMDSNATALTNATHTGHILLSATSGGVVVTQSITVTLTLTAPTLTVSRTSLSLDAINGNDIPASAFTLSVSNRQNPVVTVTADKPWLKVTQGAGNTVSAGFSVKPDASIGPLASDTPQNGNITITTNTGNTPLSQVIPVQLKLTAPSFTASAKSLQLGGSQGRDLSAGSLSMALGVPLGSTPWTVTSAPAWVTLSRTGGTFLSNDNGLSLTPKLAALSPGQTSGELVLNTQVNGDKLQLKVPVSMSLDQHKLIPSDVGVAFTKTPGWSRLTKTISVRDNMGLVSAWAATSDQTWLTVTASGKAGEPLVLTANPAALATNQVYTATVTLKSPDTTIATPEKIRVGLWVGAGNPGTIVTIPRTQADHFVLDPIRPLMYTTNASSQDLVVYNLYTGKVVSTLAGVASGNQGGVASPDGSRLYLYKGASVAAVIDLDKMSKLPDLAVSLDADSLVARPNGKPVLLGAGLAWDASTGTALGGGLPVGNSWVFAADLSTAYGSQKGSSPSTVSRYSLDHSLAWLQQPLRGGTLTGIWQAGSYCPSLALSPDGSTLAAACGATLGSNVGVYAFTRFNVASGQAIADLLALPSPNGVQYGPDGRLFGTASSPYQGTDFWVFNADSSVKYKTLLNGGSALNLVETGSLRVSGDGFLAVVSLTNDPTSTGSLKIVPVGP